MTSAVDGSPIAGATIQIDTWAASYTLKTDKNGYYQLWLDVRNNPLQVIAAKDGFQPQVKTVKITKGGTTHDRLRAEEGVADLSTTIGAAGHYARRPRRFQSCIGLSLKVSRRYSRWARVAAAARGPSPSRNGGEDLPVLGVDPRQVSGRAPRG